ncbi:hypothetical protein [Streptomyces sp. NPDC057460]|uniref:hypothetical protein n=1 Tax=Streptomyces sp. NPDC057460 TaxID=3346141 RepID=UPI00369DB53F
MTNDIETLLTALYVKIDDELAGPRRLGKPPVLTDSELVCLALAQSLLGFTSETHWLRYAGKHLTGMFPYIPQQSGYNKRLRSALSLVKRVIRMLAKSSDFWLDDCWIVDPGALRDVAANGETLGPGRMWLYSRVVVLAQLL